ncbi:MAG: hypothetical protein EOO38_23690 [Cytophagaceae bacterium]|nr:MAG: hypothetical protein EOO38_23690 [Cytophagaceae bacterium]
MRINVLAQDLETLKSQLEQMRVKLNRESETKRRLETYIDRYRGEAFTSREALRAAAEEVALLQQQNDELMRALVDQTALTAHFSQEPEATGLYAEYAGHTVESEGWEWPASGMRHRRPSAGARLQSAPSSLVTTFSTPAAESRTHPRNSVMSAAMVLNTTLQRESVHEDATFLSTQLTERAVDTEANDATTDHESTSDTDDMEDAQSVE